MNELGQSDRLQPFLLDRLRNDQPEARADGRGQRALVLRRVRVAVQRDLTWLLSAKARRAEDGFSRCPRVERSVLNFGTAGLAGATASGVSVEQAERLVRQAIETFEPRILRDTLSVRHAADAPGSVIVLDVSGQVWSLPFPEPLYVRVEVDLETGLCEVWDV